MKVTSRQRDGSLITQLNNLAYDRIVKYCGGYVGKISDLCNPIVTHMFAIGVGKKKNPLPCVQLNVIRSLN